MKKVFLCVIVGLMLALTACAPVAGEVLQSEKQRVTSPDVREADLATLVDENSAFAFDLYQALRAADGNLFYSPHSISIALAMIYAGARGKTAQQMKDTLHFVLSQDPLHPTFNSLDLELGRRGQGAKGKRGQEFRLNIVNAIWGQKDCEFLPEFLDLIAENYGAGVRTLDFENAPEESRVTINKWVSDQTEGRIEDLIPQDLIDSITRLVLTNAVYFNAAWQHLFHEDVTEDGPFYLLDGGEVTVPMMSQTESFGYAEGNEYQAVELPYYGGELSMVILLPAPGQFEAFEDRLDAAQVSVTLGKLERQGVRLTMPRFEFESSFSLKRTLAAMGMPDAFVWPIADFSGISNERLYIKDVVHKTFVSVDEAGTEAAAATGGVMPPSAMPVERVEVTVDHPFVFLIRDIETGTILFVGRVINPSA